MKTLIVVDMQNDFIDGSLGTKEAQRAKSFRLCIASKEQKDGRLQTDWKWKDVRTLINRLSDVRTGMKEHFRKLRWSDFARISAWYRML